MGIAGARNSAGRVATALRRARTSSVMRELAA